MPEQESRYTTGEHAFDGLAKGLAVGVSRRKALRLMGAALVGGALASLPGAGWAHHKRGHRGGGGQQRGNSACVQTCKAQEPPGKGRGQCISAAARGKGCAPGNPCEDAPSVECPDNSAGAQVCLNVEGEAVVEKACCPHETSSGAMCIANKCTGTIDCVCCPPGGPCPCLEVDETDPCIVFGYSCNIAP